MDTKKKMVLTTVGITVLAFLMAPPGPLGGFWPEPNHDAAPTGGLIPAFMLLGLLEAAAFGFGVAFWVFGRNWSRSVFGTGALATAAHVSIGFLTANFWLHDNLHIINGMNMAGIAVIDALFHVPLMIAGVILVAAVARLSGNGGAAGATA